MLNSGQASSLFRRFRSASALLLGALSLAAMPACYGSCGVDLSRQIAVQLGTHTPAQGGRSLIQTVTLINSGAPLKGSVYFGIGNLPEGVEAVPVPANATATFTSECQPNVKYFRIYLGPENEWPSGTSKTLKIAFPFSKQPLLYNHSVIKGTVPDFHATPGDYDGDHIADLTLFNPVSGQWTIKYSSTKLPSQFHFGAPKDQPIAGDFDGDLKNDFALYRPATQTWLILQSSDGEPRTVVFGTPTAVPVPADYDGDGYTDIAVYDPPTNRFFGISSRDKSPFVVQLGQPGDIPVPADYDGDTKADFAVYRPGSKTFFILSSNTKQPITVVSPSFSGRPFAFETAGEAYAPATYDPATGHIVVQPLGQAAPLTANVATNAIPVVADFNGDGQPDLATYLRGSAQWSIDDAFLSPALHLLVSFTFGIPGEDVPVTAALSVMP